MPIVFLREHRINRPFEDENAWRDVGLPIEALKTRDWQIPWSFWRGLTVLASFATRKGALAWAERRKDLFQ